MPSIISSSLQLTTGLSTDITIATPFVRNACAGARLAGYDLARILAESGIPPALLDNPRGRIPVDAFIILLRRLMRLLDDECLGLLDEPQPIGSFALAAKAALHEHQLLDGMQAFIQAANLLSGRLVHELNSRSGEWVWSMRARGHTHIRNPYVVESTAMTAHRFFCWLGRRRIPVKRAEFPHPAPSWAAEYRHLFYGAPVLFNRETTRLVMRAPEKAALVDRSFTELSAYIEAAPNDLFTPLSTRQVSQQARRLILDSLRGRHRMLSSRECAAGIGLAPQSFWRALNREGTDYRTLRSEVRRDLALRLLRETEMGIENIAERAGYSESSSFVRAFRQWTDMTPLRYRKLNRGHLPSGATRQGTRPSTA